jgi:hypothetical protein
MVDFDDVNVVLSKKQIGDGAAGGRQLSKQWKVTVVSYDLVNALKTQLDAARFQCVV